MAAFSRKAARSVFEQVEEIVIPSLGVPVPSVVTRDRYHKPADPLNTSADPLKGGRTSWDWLEESGEVPADDLRQPGKVGVDVDQADLRCVETIHGEGAVHLRYEVRPTHG